MQDGSVNAFMEVIDISLYDSFHRKCYPQKCSKSMNSKFSVQIQIQFVFVLRDTEKSELFDLVDFGDVAF